MQFINKYRYGTTHYYYVGASLESNVGTDFLLEQCGQMADLCVLQAPWKWTTLIPLCLCPGYEESSHRNHKCLHANSSSPV